MITSHQADAPTIQEVKTQDLAKNTFDGQKADLYVNTGIGKHFLVKVTKADGQPMLIAIHL